MQTDPPLAGLNKRFHDQLVTHQPLLGSFVKTPHPIVIEVMALSGFDFAVIDAEHGPFDRASIDLMLLAGQAAGLPLIVRVPDDRPATLLGVLDCGAAGVMVPHVTSVAQAASIARACRYSADGRGYAGTTRAAGYGTRDARAHYTSTAQEVVVICQIEDIEGARNAADIAATDGVDAIFVGRADLAVSAGFSGFFAEETARMAGDILCLPGAVTGLYCAPGEELRSWRATGATLFVIGSDHTLLMQGGAALRQEFDQNDREDPS